MSDIEIGSVWFNRCDGVDAVVVSVGSDCIGFTQMVCGKKCFYSHTVEEFKEYYKPLVQADMVNHPPHYKDESGIECIEVTKHMSFCGGNCFKYLYRAGKKDSTVEDLKKAKWYAKRAGELEERTSSKEWAKALRTVFKYRDGNIYKAMVAIRYHWWARVEAKIEAEIARLESE